jgi:four helix bundle protein
MRSFFPHESLRAYKQLVEVARWLGAAPFPRGMAKLKAQALEAAQSAVLNTAEGRGRQGQARRNHYEIAYASAAEACSALDLVDIKGAREHQDKLRAAGSMLHGLMP